jgi:hypothetical protein
MIEPEEGNPEATNTVLIALYGPAWRCAHLHESARLQSAEAPLVGMPVL